MNGQALKRAFRVAVVLAGAAGLVVACGGTHSSDEPSGSGGQGSGGTRSDGGSAGTSGAGAAGAANGGNSGAGGTKPHAGAGGCFELCPGCSATELEVHCSFGSRSLGSDDDYESIEETCEEAARAFAGEGGAAGSGGEGGVEVGGGADGNGGTATDFCDGYVERGEVTLACGECRAIDRWTKIGTCTVEGECCVLESYLFCG
jgi:hypothetical protein